ADYVDAMWLMLQADRPGDYVVGTGESHSVEEFLELAFGHVGLDWRAHVKQDPRYLRPSEVDDLRADASKIRHELGWQPRVSLPELVRRMVDSDVELAARERRARGGQGAFPRLFSRSFPGALAGSPREGIPPSAT